MISSYVFICIIGCSVVTLLPRVVPFLISKRIHFPEWFTRFLSYVPLCILTALLMQSVLEMSENGLPKIKLLEVLSCLPTLLIALRTKDLMKTVIIGIVTMAFLRML